MLVVCLPSSDKSLHNMRRLIFLVLLFPSVFVSCLRLNHRSFEYVKSFSGKQLVLFYHSSDAAARNAIDLMNDTAQKMASAESIQFNMCDGDDEENQEEFEGAQFSKGSSYIFTSDPLLGIEKYSLDHNAETLSEYLFFKMGNAPSDPAMVLPFLDEDEFYERMDRSDPPTPQFVKFFESWCQHCKQLKPVFERAATNLTSIGVDFVEVECSRDEETKTFCSRHKVASYPVLKLFTGEDQILYEEPSRDPISFRLFFQRHLGSSVKSSISKASPTGLEAKYAMLQKELEKQNSEVKRLNAELKKVRSSCSGKCGSNMDELLDDLHDDL